MTHALLVACVVCGVLALGLPTEALVGWAAKTGAERAEGLQQGARLFKLNLALLAVALGACGLWLRRAPAREVPRERCGGRPTLGSALALVGVLVLATGLRAFRLESGLWFDEVVTLVEFVRLSPIELATTYTALNNHILYSLLAHASIALFGESAWALRLPAALLGVASIAALWALGARLGSHREALLAALLLAVSYQHVWFSQNARGYTGLLLLSLLGTSLFLEGLRRPSVGPWLAYAGVLALALYTHLSGAFVFAAHGIVCAFLWARHRAGGSFDAAETRTPGIAGPWPWIGFAIGGLLALQLYAILVPQVVEAFVLQSGADSVNVKVSVWTSPLWTAVEILRGLGLDPVSLAAGAVAGVLAATGLWSYARREPVAAAVMVLPVPLTLATLLALSFHLWPRYFLVLIGFAALAIVRGAFACAERAARGRDRRVAARLGTALAGTVIAASALSLADNYRLPKQDYAGARDFVQSHRLPGEPVVTVGLATFPFVRYYAPEWHGVETLDELDGIRARSRTWLVYSFPTYMDSAHPGIAERIRNDFVLLREFPGTLGGGTIYVCRSREPAEARGGREKRGRGAPSGSDDAVRERV